jgi:peptidoglycan-associated lipoprotein
MCKKSFAVLILVLFFGLILTGCPKKTQVKEEPSAKTAAQLAEEKERAARLEAEKRREEARIREEDQRRREEERKKEEERKSAAAQKELERSLKEKKTAGIEGSVFESSMLKDVYFEFDRYEIRPGDADVLKQNAALMTKYPHVKIQVEGHCDERGTAEYNLALGERRANSVKKYLVSLGIAPGRISTISYGEEKPADAANTEAAWAKNRRAHSVITSR